MSPHPFEVRDQWVQHNPGLDTSPMEIVALVKRTAWAIDGALSTLYEGAPMTASELDLLLPLRYSPEPVIARRLAENMRLSPAAISKTLARLEQRGYITRLPCPANRRAALVRITDAGREAIDGLFPRQLAIEAQLLSGLGADRGPVAQALQRLLEVVERAARPMPTSGAWSDPVR